MRLINTTTFKVENFAPGSIPEYAILSHTWLPEGEVTLQDLAIPEKAKIMPGYSKIAKTCDIARQKNINYAWVDTCCIDKTSSAELSESINAMFAWYRHSKICLTYLSDFLHSEGSDVDEEAFAKSKWFKRGWTLQELLASKHIEFYDNVWTRVGTKQDLLLMISRATGIQVRYITGGIDSILAASVGTRMFWAAKRQTTQPEDMAHSLLGIFNVSMPLLYGIGSERAFIRLQEEIIKENNDLSIFAWTTPTEGYRGVLARSVSEFGQFSSDTGPFRRGEFSMTNNGLKIRTALTSCPTNTGHVQLMNVGAPEPILLQRLGHLIVRSIRSQPTVILLGAPSPIYSGNADSRTIFIAKNITKADEKELNFPLYTINVKNLCEEEFSVHGLKAFPTTRWDVHRDCVGTAITPTQSRPILGFVTFRLSYISKPPGPSDATQFGSRLLLFMWLSKSNGDSFASPRYSLYADNSGKTTVASRLFAALDQGGEDSYMSDIDMSPPFYRDFGANQPMSHMVTGTTTTTTDVRVCVKVDSTTNYAHNQAKYTYIISVESVLPSFLKITQTEATSVEPGKVRVAKATAGSTAIHVATLKDLSQPHPPRGQDLPASRLPRPLQSRLGQIQATESTDLFGSSTLGPSRKLSMDRTLQQRKHSSEFNYMWESKLCPMLESLLNSIDQGGYSINIQQGKDAVTRTVYVQTDNTLAEVHREAILEIRAEIPETFRSTTKMEFLVASGDEVVFCVDKISDIEPFCEPQNFQLYDVVMCGDSVGLSGNEYATTTLGPMLIVGGITCWLVSLHLFDDEKGNKWTGIDGDVLSSLERKLVHPSEPDLDRFCKVGDGRFRSNREISTRIIGHSGTMYKTFRRTDSMIGPPDVTSVTDWALCVATETPRVNTLRHISPENVFNKPNPTIQGIIGGDIGSRLVYSTGRTSGTRWGIICSVPVVRKEHGVRVREWYIENVPQSQGGLLEDEWNRSGMGLPGDSGAAVVDFETNRLIGMIWGRNTYKATSTSSQLVLFTPITVIFDDIEEKLGLGQPTLPGAKEPFCLIVKPNDNFGPAADPELSGIRSDEEIAAVINGKPFDQSKKVDAAGITVLALDRSHLDTLITLGNQASTCRNEGRWKEAEDLELQVVETRKRTLGQEHPSTLSSLGNLALTYRNQGRWKEAEDLEVQVMETSLKVLGNEHPDTLTSIANLASTFWNEGRWQEAEDLEVQVLKTRKRVLGKEHLSTLTSMANLASTFWNQGRWKEAEELEVQVLETRMRVLGQEHPDTLTSLGNLASTYRNQGHWNKAEDLEVQVVESRKRILGKEHPDTLTSMANLASTYRNQGRWEEAEQLEVQVMETSKRKLGADHPDTLTSMANLASTYRNQGRWEEAEQLEVQVMEMSSRVLGQEHPDTLTSMANLASTYRNQGRRDEAEELEVQVMETRKKKLGADHPSTLTSMNNLAITWKVLGRDIEALQLMEECVKLQTKIINTNHPDTLFSYEPDNSPNSTFKITDHHSQQHLLDSQTQNCLNDLRTTDPRDDKKRIEETNGGLLEDSYRWILDHPDFHKWCNNEQGRVLWIKGDPGRGKTMLLCGIIDEMSTLTKLRSKEATALLSYFFCQATDPRINTAVAVLRGLIYLLIDQQPLLILHVRKMYDQAGKGLFEDANAWVALSEIFTSILQDQGLNKAYLIIDALDECVVDLPKLLDFIVQKSSISPRIKWVVSSRNRSDIKERLDRIGLKIRLCLELNQKSVSAAVRTYTEHKIFQLAEQKKYDERTRVAVLQHVVANANDTFLWVSLVCENLKNVSRRKTLAKLNEFPTGLDPLYRRMIFQINQSVDIDLCQQILAIMLTVYRPITLTEITCFIEKLEDITDDHESLAAIIGLCGSFLALRESTIYFVHQSAKDFLLKEEYYAIFPSGIEDVHYIIFSRSLQVMSKTLRRNVYSLGTPGISINQVEPADQDPLAAVRYSCLYWVNHLLDCSTRGKSFNDLKDSGSIQKFLYQSFLYWLEALSLMKGVSEGITIIIKLEKWLQADKSPDLYTFIHDAKRFTLYNRFVIEQTPLQLYCSALVFAPEKSIIRAAFKHCIPSWIERKPKVQEVWSAVLQTLEGHSDTVTSVAFSPDGRQVVSGSWDQTVRLWDAAIGVPLQTLEGHSNTITSVAFSPDCKKVGSGSRDQMVQLWDATTGALLQTLEGHSNTVTSVAFSPDSKQVVSGSWDQTVRLWDAATGVLLQTIKGHSNTITTVCFSPNGKQVVSGSDDRMVRLWDAKIGVLLQTLKGHSNAITSVAFSPDGKQVVSGSYDQMVRLWDAATGALLQTLESHSDAITSVAFSSNSKQVVSGSYDRTVRLWDAATGALLQTLEGHSDTVTSVAFSPDSKQVVSGSYDRTVRLWDAVIEVLLQMPEGHSDIVTSVAFSPDGKQVVSGSWDQTVQLWDAIIGVPLQMLEGHSDTVTSVAFSPNGKQVVSGSYDRTVRLWDTATGELLQTLEGHFDTIISVAFSSDGKQVVSKSWDATVRLWDAATGALLQTLEGHSDIVTSVASLPNDKLLPILSVSNNWVVEGTVNILWLPPDYRSNCKAIWNGNVVLAHLSGRISFFKFTLGSKLII